MRFQEFFLLVFQFGFFTLDTIEFHFIFLLLAGNQFLNITPVTGSETMQLRAVGLDDWGNYVVSDVKTLTMAIPDEHQHDLTYVPAVKPTAAEDGNIEYWYCSDCGKYYADAGATEEISQKDTIIPAGSSMINPFEDVAEGAFYYNPVLWAVSHKPQITNGLTATTFGPGETCKRGQVVTFLWRAMGEPEPKSTKNLFTDVGEKAFYYKAVLWAVENNITSGTSKTTFSPNDPCTRGQVATFLYRTQGSPKVTAENPFSDLDPKGFYYNAVLWAVSSGVTNGTTPTTFSPGAACTRGQIVTFLYRALAGQG